MPLELLAYLASLRSGEVIPPPIIESWPLMIARIRQPGCVNEIDDDVFEHFLGCLPPQWMGQGGFAFAEGAEPLSLFWQSAGKHFVRQLTWHETYQFCRLASIPIPC